MARIVSGDASVRSTPPKLHPATSRDVPWRQQAHDRARQDRLARTGLADDPERLPALKFERDAVDRANDTVAGIEMRDQ